MKCIKKINNKRRLFCNQNDEFCLFQNSKSSYILCMENLKVINIKVKEVSFFVFDNNICYLSNYENDFYKFDIENNELTFLGKAKESNPMGYELINLTNVIVGIGTGYSKKMVFIDKKTDQIIDSITCFPKYCFSENCKYDENTLFVKLISPVSCSLPNMYYHIHADDIDNYKKIDIDLNDLQWKRCHYIRKKKYYILLDKKIFYIFSESENKIIYHSCIYDKESFICFSYYIDENNLFLYFVANGNELFEFDLNTFQIRYTIVPNCEGGGLAISKKHNRLLTKKVENDRGNIYIYDFDFCSDENWCLREM